MPRRPLAELLDVNDPAWPTVQTWINQATNRVELLPAPSNAGAELEAAQVTVRSGMGAVVYHTGGLLIDGGWLRILGGGGHPRMRRSLMGWNRTRTFDDAGNSTGLLLVADDVLGGFFAMNWGALGPEVNTIHYFAPDTLRWEALEGGYSYLLHFAFRGDIKSFYESYRWTGWQDEIATLTGDESLAMYPPLWTKEGKRPGTSHRVAAPVAEVYAMNLIEFPRQLGP